MPYSKTTWVNEVLDGAERFKILDNGGVNAVDAWADLAQCVIQLQTTVTTPGTPINAENLQKLEDAMEAIYNTVESTTNDFLIYLKVLGADEVWTTGDGKIYFPIPPELNNAVLINAQAYCLTAASAGTPNVQVARGRRSTAAGALSYVDMLSVPITIDATEFSSTDAAAQRTINLANDDVRCDSTYRDTLRIDIDTAGTGTKGLDVSLVFRK